MTIICVLRQNGQTWVGSDTLVTNNNYTFRSSSKWVVENGRAIGCSGSQRVDELIRSKHNDLFSTTTTPLEVGIYIQNLCLDNGFKPARDDKGYGWQHFNEGELYVDETGIYFLDTTFTPALIDEPFWARGSGGDIAFGAYYAVKEVVQQKKVMETAIAAAIQYDDSCGGDIWIKRLI